MEDKLRSLGQDHILKLEGFNSAHAIAEQLKGLDIEESLGFYESAKTAAAGAQKIGEVSPLREVIDATNPAGDFEAFKAKGAEAIRASSVATVIMSGGQGTRLNFDGPKGMYDMDLPSKRSIFQIHMENIMAVRSQMRKGSETSSSSCTIPVYIMTSDLNDSIIRQYFEENDYFGYGKDDIFFFQQGLEPCISNDGKIIVESKSRVSMAPDGNGGLYNALRRTGAFDDMMKKGVKHLHIYGIDNVLTKAADPLFIGCCIARESEVGNKVVWRANASEKVGVAVEKEGRMTILEYSEIPKELADAVKDGKLTYGAGNICNHYVHVDFLRDVIYKNLLKMYHLAPKKIPYLDMATGETILPSINNGVKLELFIFDPFPLATKWTVVEVLRAEEFAPVKNASGSNTDSPDTAREMITAQAVRWLEEAGAVVQRSSERDTVEVSPFRSLNGEGLESFAGQTVTAPIFIA